MKSRPTPAWILAIALGFTAVASRPVTALAATCEITVAMEDEVVFGALNFRINYGAAPGTFDGVDIADCTDLVGATFAVFLLDPVSPTLSVAFLSLTGIGGSPFPLPLATCRYTGEVPETTDFIVITDEATGTGVPPPDIVPLPTISITRIVCEDTGCQSDAECDDGLECTTDTCDTASGQCNSTALPDESSCSLGLCCGGLCTASTGCVLPGDCNANGLLDAGDPTCTILCTIGLPPSFADCDVGGDCNCNGILDAGDSVCAVLRLIDDLPDDPCTSP